MSKPKSKRPAPSEKKRGFVPAETALTIAAFLRNSRSSVLKTTEGVCMGKRVDYFEGKAFLESLRNAKYKDAKLREQVQNYTDDELQLLATQFMKAQFIHEAEITYKANKEDKTVDDVDRLEIVQSPEFDEDAVYCWILPPSQTPLYLMSFGLLIGAILICLFKVWPLWAKIGVWWISVILLVSMLSIFAVRLVLAAIFWMIGFRGLWLFPNLFDDDIGILDTFTPVFGYGRLVEEAKRKKKERKEKKEKAEKDKAEKEKQKGEPEDSSDNKEKKTESKDKESKDKETPKKKDDEKTWKFGLINFAVIMIVGLIVCNQLGILAGENIPEFLISQKEIWNKYPSLLSAPPADLNETDVILDEDNLTKDEEDENPSIDHLLDGEEED